MALLMARALRGRGLIRSAILIPWAIPTAISGCCGAGSSMSTGLPTRFSAPRSSGRPRVPGQGGNHHRRGVEDRAIRGTAHSCRGCLIIPEELYEAARIDGASAWQRFVNITLPLVKPSLTVAVLFRLLDALRMFDLPYILIGPRKSSVETLSMLAQNEAYNVRYGAAAAYAIILFGYVSVIAFVFVKVLGANINRQQGVIW